MTVTGTDLRTIRLKGGKTTSQMAKLANVRTRKTYESWEKNISSPSINQFISMAIGCGFRPEYLVKILCERNSSEEALIIDDTALKQ